MFLINGVNTRFDHARQVNLPALQRALGDTYGDRILEYENIYNPTAGLGSDLVETYRLRFSDLAEGGDPDFALGKLTDYASQLADTAMSFPTVAEAVDAVTNLAVTASSSAWSKLAETFPSFASKVDAVAEGATASLSEELRVVAERFRSSATLTPADRWLIAKMLITVQWALDAHERVLIVAHSEGNLFANEVYQGLVDATDVRVMHVAPPTNTLSGRPWVTTYQDGVILPLRLLGIAADANANLWTLRLFQAHDFTSYLSPGSNPNGLIVGESNGLLGELNDPVVSTTNLWSRVGETPTVRLGLTYRDGVSRQATWKVVKGSTPPGVTLNPDGTFSGSPEPLSNASYRFTVEACNEFGHGTFREVNMTVDSGMTIEPTTLPPITPCKPYSVLLSTTGSTATQDAFTRGSAGVGDNFFLNFVVNKQSAHTALLQAWSPFAGVAKGLLPADTPPGTYPLNVYATGAVLPDGNLQAAHRLYSVRVEAQDPRLDGYCNEIRPLVMRSGTLPHATPGVSYEHQLTAEDGIPPYRFEVTSGSLPPGLVLDGATGIISGTPTSARAAYQFQVKVTDDYGVTALANLTLWNFESPALSLSSAFVTSDIWGSISAVGLKPGTTLLRCSPLSGCSSIPELGTVSTDGTLTYNGLFPRNVCWKDVHFRGTAYDGTTATSNSVSNPVPGLCP